MTDWWDGTMGSGEDERASCAGCGLRMSALTPLRHLRKWYREGKAPRGWEKVARGCYLCPECKRAALNAVKETK